MQLRKNIKLFILLVILSGGIVGFKYFENNFQSNESNRFKFTLVDSVGINRITITSPDQRLEFLKSPEGWKIDNQYKMDPKMIGLLFAVMSGNETLRAVSDGEGEISNRLKSSGVLVGFYDLNGARSSFYAGGNSTKTTSYFMDQEEETPYVVNIPGYSSYIAGIFDLNAREWRDKRIFNTSWNSLKTLQVVSKKDKEINLEVNYQDGFYKMKGVVNVDTSKMMNYLEYTTQLEVDQFIKLEEFTIFDSLAHHLHELEIELQDLDTTRNTRTMVYPAIPGENMRLINILPQDHWALIKEDKYKNLLRRPAYFNSGS